MVQKVERDNVSQGSDSSKLTADIDW